MVTVPSLSLRTHSWELVYERSGGMFMSLLEGCSRLHQHLSVAHERRLDHTRRELPVAHFDLHAIAGLHRGWHSRERDRARQRGAESTAGDLAAAMRRMHDLMRPQHAARILEHEP